MSPLAGARAVVFDLDGVLWHSQRAHHAAYAKVLEGLGLPVPSYAELAGRKTREVFEHLVQEHGLSGGAARAAELTAAKQAEAQRLLRESPPLADGCGELLRALAPRFLLGLASSASPASVALFFEASGTRALFGAVVTGDDVTQAKPAPEAYQKALALLGVAPADAVVVEDAPSGIEAALAAGARAVGVEGTCGRAELERAGVVAVVKDIRELWP